MQTPAAVLAAVLTLLAAPAAQAQPVSARSGPDTYLEFDLGAFIPQSGDLSALDPGVALSGTFGARFNPWLGAEATFGYYRASASNTALGVMPILVDLRLVAPLKGVEFSVRGGVGIHFAAFNPFGGSYATSTAFGWQVGASAAFNLSPTMLVGVDVLGTFADAKFSGATVSIDGLTVSMKLGYRL